MAHPGGRPTKYRPEYCQELIDFFDKPATEIVKLLKTYKDGSTEEIIKEIPTSMPFVSRFARHLGVEKSTIYEWAAQHPEFSSALKMAKECRKEKLIDNALRGNYNASFAGLVAKNMLGWADRSESKLSGDKDSPLVYVIEGGANPYSNKTAE